MDLSGIDLTSVPKHMACVMDGNGRWATQRGLKRTDGHSAGEEALLDAVHGALEVGVEWLTVYAFSTENWRRPTDEVRFLMKFNESLLVRRRDELNDLGVRIRFIGRRDWRVPRRLIKRMDESTALTNNNTATRLVIAFNYGSRDEIVRATRRLAEAVKAGVLDPQDINDHTLSTSLDTEEWPDPDLIIRTSGEQRLSNFLMWQAAYSEFVFMDCLWPDFCRETLEAALTTYYARDRRYGGLAVKSAT